MITVRAQNGHIVRIIVAMNPLAVLDDASHLYGIAECSGCGNIHAFTTPDPLPEDDDEMDDTTLAFVKTIVEVFEATPCPLDGSEDQEVDWRDDETPSAN
jgi:hypothetical protein